MEQNSDTQLIYNLFKERYIVNKKNSRETILTGINALDYETQGFEPGKLTVIGGRPAMGKTKLATTLALNISIHHPVLFCSLENPIEELFGKIVSQRVKDTYVESIITGEKKLKTNYLSRVFKNHQLYLSEKMYENTVEFINFLDAEIQKNKIKVVFIDTVQLAPHSGKGENLLLLLKMLAVAQKVAVVLMSQVKRTCELRGGLKKPQIFDLPSPSDLQEEADTILMIYRAEYYGIIEETPGISTRDRMEIMIHKLNGKIVKNRRVNIPFVIG